MVPVFFAWRATDTTDVDALRATGIGACGTRWECAPHSSGLIIGIIYADHHNARVIADQLHPDLLTMPGANGKLSDKHAAHISRQLPKAKAGDTFADLLLDIHTNHGHAWADPNVY